jgi:MFS transporter, PAT family, beta-lactamase induction signal transducer AmpG
MELTPDKNTPSLLLWMPTLYFAMGVPLNVVVVVAAIMYKNLGLSNTEIALYTGSMYLAWVIKPLWSPFIDLFKTKKFFVLLPRSPSRWAWVASPWPCRSPGWLPITIGFFWIIAFLSATQDIAADGVYINTMTPQQQAKYIGAQGICWYGGKILATGLLVSFTGYLHSPDMGLGLSWIALLDDRHGSCWARCMLGLALWHRIMLPVGGQAVASG